MIHRSSPVPFITSRPNPQLLETVSPKLFKLISVQQTQIRNQTVSLLDMFIPGGLVQAPAPFTSYHSPEGSVDVGCCGRDTDDGNLYDYKNPIPFFLLTAFKT